MRRGNPAHHPHAQTRACSMTRKLAVGAVSVNNHQTETVFPIGSRSTFRP
jgi:hypothetical protein